MWGKQICWPCECYCLVLVWRLLGLQRIDYHRSSMENIKIKNKKNSENLRFLNFWYVVWKQPGSRFFQKSNNRPTLEKNTRQMIWQPGGPGHGPKMVILPGPSCPSRLLGFEAPLCLSSFCVRRRYGASVSLGCAFGDLCCLRRICCRSNHDGEAPQWRT